MRQYEFEILDCSKAILSQDDIENTFDTSVEPDEDDYTLAEWLNDNMIGDCFVWKGKYSLTRVN